MIEYPLEPGQRMIIKPNYFPEYAELAHLVVSLGDVKSTKEGIIVKDCMYMEEHRAKYLDIPLVLLWRIADEEDLLEMHEVYMQFKNLHQVNR